MGTCSIIPQVTVNNSKVDSKLFRELTSYLGSRDAAKAVYSYTVTEEFKSKILPDLETNEIGEPTLEATVEIFKLSPSHKGSFLYEKKKAGAIDSNGNTIKYDKLVDAKRLVDTFNFTNKEAVALVKGINGSYSIEVLAKKFASELEVEKQKKAFALHEKLLSALRSLGFDISIENNPEFNGVFDPLNVEKNAEGLLTIIRIAQGQRGQDAFPEEFAHAIIAGMRNNPLVVRLLNSISSEETIKEILGEEYDTYHKLYEGDLSRLAEEAAGKLVASFIKGAPMPSIPQRKSLLQRIWDYIKNLFTSKLFVEDISNIYQNTKDLSDFILEKVDRGTLIEYIDRSSIINARKLYQVQGDVSRLHSMAEEQLKALSKQLNLSLHRNKDSKYNPEDVSSIKQIQKLIENKSYAASVYEFMKAALRQIEALKTSLDSTSDSFSKDKSNLENMTNAANALQSIKEFVSMYGKLLKEIRDLPLLYDEGHLQGVLHDRKTAEDLQRNAKDILDIVYDLERGMESLRYEITYNYLSMFWEGDLNTGDKILTLRDILNYAEKDINFLDKLLLPLAGSSDAVLSLVSKALATARGTRDARINELRKELTAAHLKLTRAGYTTDFIYERDSEGRLTGRLVSNYDFEAYYKARREYLEELKEKVGNDYLEIDKHLLEWESANNTITPVIKGENNEVLRSEKLPRLDMYASNALDNAGWSAEQREYYELYIKMKRELELMLPENYVHTYKALQYTKDNIEVLADNNPGKKKARQLLYNLKSSFVRREDEVDFGNLDGTHTVVLDGEGKPIKAIPIIGTRRIKNTSMLSTDATGSMIAFIGSTIHYNEMSKISGILESVKEVLYNRDIQQNSGSNAIKEFFKVLGRTYSSNYVVKGGSSAEKLEAVLDANIYGRRKRDEGAVTVGDTTVDIAKAADAFKNGVSMLTLGFNPLSALGNVVVGKLQLLFEARGGEHFNYKESVQSANIIRSLLREYIAELGEPQRFSKLALIADMMDPSGNFYETATRDKAYQSKITRILGESWAFLGLDAGEWYLKMRPLIAMMLHKKLLHNGKEISLYDALEVEREMHNGKVVKASLKLKDGVTNLDGSTFTTENINGTSDLQKFKLRTKRVVQSMSGAFNADDKGIAHQYMVGRFLLQFRQWAPEHYTRRFRKKYYDFEYDGWREGYYNTTNKFIINAIKNARQMQFNIATQFDQLKPYEKANIRKALAEVMAMVSIIVLIKALGPLEDSKGKFSKRLAQYLLHRANLEVGASIPYFLPTFINNITTMLKSPFGSLQTAEDLTNILYVWNMFESVEQGQFRGYSEWQRDVIKVMPMTRHVWKFMDLDDESYAFALFRQ